MNTQRDHNINNNLLLYKLYVVCEHCEVDLRIDVIYSNEIRQ